jgi:hypothetical protein
MPIPVSPIPQVRQEVSGHRKCLKFFLVDQHGQEHLAAVAEDLGDAHYNYRNTQAFAKFGAMETHQRKELLMWLDMIIKETCPAQEQEAGARSCALAPAAGASSTLRPLAHQDQRRRRLSCRAVQQEQGSEGGVQYVGHRQAKEYYDDGRRRNLFFLMDQNGAVHGQLQQQQQQREAMPACCRRRSARSWCSGRASDWSAPPPQASSTWP